MINRPAGKSVETVLSGAAFALLLISLAASLGCHTALRAADGERYWPQWRGPLSSGAAPDADPPVEWSESKNIRWKLELPGRGHSTPVIWKDRIFVTSAVPFGDRVESEPEYVPGAHHNLPVTHRQKYMVLAVARRDGEIIWQRTLSEGLPRQQGHYTGSLASHSPVTDGEHLIAFFGSAGLYGLDLDGNLLWEKDFGDMRILHAHGEGASPALYGNTLIVNWDHEGQSFVAAFDKRTGKQIWRVARDEVTSWASPIVVEHAGKAHVVVSGTGRVRGYDLLTGRVIWECGGLSRNVVASPVAADGMVYAASSYDTRAMLAIRLEGAEGDITGSSQVVWSRRQRTPYVPSPLLYGDSLYFLRHYQGILSRLHAETGEERHGPFRLRGIGNVYASPVGAAGRIYITDREGATLVMSHSDSPRILALTRLNDSFSASAAVVGRELYLRGQKHLYSIGQE